MLKDTMNVLGLDVQHDINFARLLDLPESVAIRLSGLELIKRDFPVLDLRLLEEVLQTHDTCEKERRTNARSKFYLLPASKKGKCVSERKAFVRRDRFARGKFFASSSKREDEIGGTHRERVCSPFSLSLGASFCLYHSFFVFGAPRLRRRNYLGGISNAHGFVSKVKNAFSAQQLVRAASPGEDLSFFPRDAVSRGLLRGNLLTSRSRLNSRLDAGRLRLETAKLLG